MKVLESAENYLETIYILGQQSNGVHAIDIAGELGFSKPSVSIAMKRLRENGYITIDEFQHISLTPSGLEIAERVYKRHDLLRRLLMRLGVSEEIASNDACRIEHVLSEESFACIRKHMEEDRE
ncbi:MAG: metal-dependent transcriptional regulator [Ruminococcaceae bacterium]|nr:metal-dependent transcriptional regulator [Oscillospiraceae bacterium]